ncbi:amino acid racemase [Candidatus Dojkabacteria bacterium]|nr:amino acid racemase [Candidatus Dojkabacteria bacterium]
MNKIIGILGGVGPQATAILYKKIIEFSQKNFAAKNNDDYPRVIIDSVPIPDFISNKDGMGDAKKMLKKSVGILTQAGATRLAIASNTVHLLLSDLQGETEVEFSSIIDAVAEKCNGLKKVGLLASSVTLGADLYDKTLGNFGIEIIKPRIADRKTVDKIIRYVLAGTDNGKEKKDYVRILNSLYEAGAENVILGCTELPLAINYEALSGRIINSMNALAEELVDYYYN